ncbi:hypothetical protein HU200_009219 [Digitaria exilis]|uniref:Uncharacterized protein n=1 Tax=Digitaria exilis TaxID=1010633 RepID=A0A835KSV6_9POAL|nr:hypothetical protein HU200_009219 [Digitaria exilis]
MSPHTSSNAFWLKKAMLVRSVSANTQTHLSPASTLLLTIPQQCSRNMPRSSSSLGIIPARSSWTQEASSVRLKSWRGSQAPVVTAAGSAAAMAPASSTRTTATAGMARPGAAAAGHGCQRAADRRCTCSFNFSL